MEQNKRFNEGFAATYVQRALTEWSAGCTGWDEAQAHTDDLLEPATVDWTIQLPGGQTRTFRLTVEEVEER